MFNYIWYLFSKAKGYCVKVDIRCLSNITLKFMKLWPKEKFKQVKPLKKESFSFILLANTMFTAQDGLKSIFYFSHKN